MRRSLFRQFSIAAVVTMLVVSGALVGSGGSVASAEVSAADLSFSVTAAPNGAYAVAGEDSWILHVSVTEDGAPADLPDLGGLTVISASPWAAVSSFTHSELGLYTAQVTTDVPDTYALSVQYNGLQIGSPIIQFFSSGPDPAHSTLVAIPEQILAPCGTAVVEDPVIATATVRDSEGTGIPGLEVVFEYGADTPEVRTTDNDGVASAELFFDAPDVPTTKIVSATVTVDGVPIDLPSASVQIEPTQGCSSEEVVLNWRVEAASQVIGLPLRILITALDVNGQVTTMDRTKLTVTPSSSDVTVSIPANNRRGDGSYYVFLTTSTPGAYTVSVTYDGRSDGLSLPFSFAEPAPLPDVLPDLGQSYVFVSKWLAEPGDPVVVTAVMRDSEGQGVDNAQVVFSITGSETYQPTCVTLADGRCSVTVSSAVPATLDILARFNGQLFGSGQTVQYLTASRGYLMSTEVAAVSSGPMRADGYDSWEVWVTLLNPDGTPVTGANAFGLGFTVIDASNDTMVLSLSSSAFEAQPGGVYHAYLTSFNPGSYLVYASYYPTWADPVTVSFSAVPPNEPGARLVLTRASELDNAVQVNEADREVNAKAIVHDEQGLPMSGVKVDFTVGSDTDVISARQCYTDEAGQCSIRVWPNGLGEHSVRASIAGEPLIGSPATVRLVLPGYPTEYQAINLDQFTVSPAAGGSVPADGVSQWTGTVMLTSPYDIGLSELTGIVEEMFTPSNPAVRVGDVIDNGDDTYTVGFTSDQPGDFMVTAYYQGVAIERDIAFSEASSSASPSSSESSTSESPSSPLTSVSSSSSTGSPSTGSSSPTSSSTSSSPTSPPQSSTSSTPSVPVTSSGSSSSSSTTPTQPVTSTSSSSSSTGSPSSSLTSVPSTSGPSSSTSSSSSPTQPLTSTPVTSSSTSSSSSTSPAQSSSSSTSPAQSSTNPSTGPTSAPSSPSSSPSGPTSAPTSSAPAQGPEIDFSDLTVVQGGTLRIAGEHWVPGETVAITLYSTPLSLGTETANPDGTLPPFDVIIYLEPGQHTIEMVGSVSGTFEATFTVLAPAPSTAVSPAVPAAPTGGMALQSPARWVLFGFLIIGAGLLLTRKILRQGR